MSDIPILNTTDTNDVPRCETTGNIVGSDTVPEGHICPCRMCQSFEYGLIVQKNNLATEGQKLHDQLTNQMAPPDYKDGVEALWDEIRCEILKLISREVLDGD